MSQISIIITTWNSEKYLSDLFLSLHDMDYPKDNWNLIVVDNGSQDKTLNILHSWQKKMYNFSTIIRNTKNEGFAPANNQAIKYALRTQPDYVVLLNDDVIVESDWLDKIIQVMDKNKNIGLAQPLITRYPEVEKINSFGNNYHYIGFGYSYGEGRLIHNFNLVDYEPAYLSFTAVVIRSKVIEQIGLLDEKYFSYHEDTDFCFRARLQNWRMLVIKDAIVHHKYKFPSKKNKIRYFWLEKNRLYLMLKFFKFKTLILIFPAWLFMEFGLIFFSIFKGFFIQRIKAYGWLVMNLTCLIKIRHQIQKIRHDNNVNLFEFFSSRIDFQEINNPFLKYLANPILSLYFKIIKKII